MYNKIFTKILDSSIWLEDTPTRLIWLTFIAVMDEDGFAQFASIPNLAHRARVPLEDVQRAVACLEAPDPDSSDPENEGRRIERVPGGWMVLNAPKYRDLVTRAVVKEQTRARVKRHREKKRNCNGDVTAGNASVTQSETASTSEKEAEKSPPAAPKRALADADEEWISGIEAMDCYKPLRIQTELGKAKAWCGTNHRQCTRKFFVNWLNRALEGVRVIPNGTESKVAPLPSSKDRYGSAA